MMNITKKSTQSLILLLSLFLSGCELLHQAEKVPPRTEGYNQENLQLVVEAPPRFMVTDWHEILRPHVARLQRHLSETGLLSQAGETDNSGYKVLVGDIKNATTGYVATQQIQSGWRQSLAKIEGITLFDRKEIAQRKQALGLPADDVQPSRSKMMALARQLGADWLLTTTVEQLATAQAPAQIAFDLMSVKSGDILYHYSDAAVAEALAAETTSLMGLSETGQGNSGLDISEQEGGISSSSQSIEVIEAAYP